MKRAMFDLKKWAVFSLVILLISEAWSQVSFRAAVYNNTDNPAASAPDLYSATFMLDVAGLPFDTLHSTKYLLNYQLIVIASPPSKANLKDEEVVAIIEYVKAGGTLIIPANNDQRLFTLSGINSAFSIKSPRLHWIMSPPRPELKYFNDTMEQIVSLGKSEISAISARYYNPTTALVIARYENTKPAVLLNEIQNVKVYTFGFQWKDVILRPQVDKDFQAERMYSNGFEPSADVFPLFVRAVWETICPIAVWKHTLPDAYRGLLLITHDVDSRTGYDTMHFFSTYEKSVGISTHYFATTHYLKDDLLSAFYNDKSIAALQQVAADGHTIGSHSVSHLPDFHDENYVTRGSPGNNSSNYFPMYLKSLGHSINGTVWGEVEVSKYLLEKDIGLPCISWRSGHLCFPKALVQVLDSNGYTLNSTQSANDVLSNFPYIAQSWPAVEYNPSNVLEIPMTISDVNYVTPISASNYLQFTNKWYNITLRNAGNFAPTVLLIHPNRRFKVAAQKALIEILPDDIGVYNFEKFGKFWRNRMNTTFDISVVGENELRIKVNRSDFFEWDPPVGFIVKSRALGKNPEEMDFLFETPCGQTRKAFLSRLADTLILLHPRSLTGTEVKQDAGSIHLYPNPAKEHFMIAVGKNEKVFSLEIIDLTGKKILEQRFNNNDAIYGPVNISQTPSGIYLCRLYTSYGVITQKLFIRR